MKVVYFVRHGQSEGNAAPVFQAPDSPLSEKGKKQAEIIAQRIAKVPFDALIVSPLLRTRETAEAITRTTNTQPEYCDLFVERHKPMSISGKEYSDPVADETWRRWEQSLMTPGAMQIEEGENYDLIVRRADAALSYLRDRTESSIVVVTHGMFLRVLIARTVFGDLLTGQLLNEFMRKTSIENTSITAIRLVDAFEEDPIWRLWILNDHAHLG